MMALNTNNAAIADVLKTAPAKAATGTDNLKDILNVDLDPAYNISVICSQSFFNDIDKLKDSQGQYILQNDISSISGKKLFGRNVVVISDVLLGAAGESKAFIGDAKQFCLFADRAQASVKFNQHDIYGVIMAISQRMDVVASNTKAGFFVTLDVPPVV